MKLMKRKTKKRLRRLARTASRIGSVFAIEVMAEMAASFLERSSGLRERAESIRKRRSERHAEAQNDQGHETAAPEGA